MQRGIPVGNPIANVLVIIVGALAIGASIVLGFVAFVVLGSIVLVLGAIVSLRVWWLRRKMERQTGTQAPPRAEQQRVIEGEYHVVKGDENS